MDIIAAKNYEDSLATTTDQLVARLGHVNRVIEAQNALQSQVNNLPAGNFAPINSPTFTGIPTASTPGIGDNSAQLATTAFVVTAINGANPAGSKLYLFNNFI